MPERFNPPVLEVRIVFADGTQESRRWGMNDQPPLPEVPPFAVDPRKTWAHPQEPVVLSMLVAEGREGEAREWLESL